MADEKIPTAQTGGPDPEPAAGGGVNVTKTVKIKMSGKEFDVPPELASAYGEREQEFQRKLSETSSELGTLRKFHQEVEPVVNQLRQPQPPLKQGPNLNVLWYENPEAAAQVVEERVAQKLQAQYLQAEAIKEFWQGFYREHKDLQDDDFLVKAVFSNRYGELAPLQIRDAQQKLAEAAREELLRISRKMKQESGSHNDNQVVLEEASGERPPKPKPEELEEAQAPKSISEVIARRRQARRTAAKP